MRNTPIADSYWVVPGVLLAGEYPGAKSKDIARQKLRSLINAGVNLFIDLTEESENLEPYEPLLLEEANKRERRITYLRLPISDLDVPAIERMREIQQVISDAIEAGRTVYVHCWGGVGRTGTVVGCYLVEQEVSGAEALAEIRRLRRGLADWWRRSPETRAQEDFVKSWRSLAGKEHLREQTRDSAKAARR